MSEMEFESRIGTKARGIICKGSGYSEDYWSMFY